MRKRPRKTRRFKPSLGVREPAMILTIGLVVSLLIHVGLGAATLDQPIGYVDPASFAAERQPVRIKRATYDLVTPASRAVPGPGSPDSEAAPTVEDLSLDMLSQTPAPLPDAALEPQLQMRALEEQRVEPLAETLAVAMPGFELTPELLEQLDARSPVSPEVNAATSGGAGFDTYAGGSAKLAGTMLDTTGTGMGTTAGGNGDLSSAVAGATGRGLGLERLNTPGSAQTNDEPLTLPLDDLLMPPIELPMELQPPEPLDDDFDYMLSRFDTPGEQGYFEVEVVPRRSLRKLAAMPKDVVFLVDTSSSLPQGQVNEAVRGVQMALGTLNDGDRFNIVLFNEQVRFFSPEAPQPATTENLDKAATFLRVARAEGYTDVNAALSRLLQRGVDADRVYDLVLISDGRPTRGIVDTRELINLITRDNDLNASIYCVGIGRRPDRELLNFLAYRNKGYCLFTIEQDRTAATIVDLLSRIRYPLIKDVQLNIVGLDPSTVFPRDLPNIHQNERFKVFGRYAVPGPFTMRILGKSAGGPVDFTFNRNLDRAPVGDAGIARDWAFWKLHHLYSEIIRRGDSPALQRQIEQIGERYGLKTLY